jgi:parvulin-like peptidyl-prolyl isomerase
MTTCLRIGNRLLNSDQIITALVQYKLLDLLIGHVLLDEAIQSIALSKQELAQFLAEPSNSDVPADLEDLSQWCESRGIAPAYFKSVMLREWRIEKFKRQYFANQLESEFLRTKVAFDQVEYSLIQLDDPVLAQEVYYQIRDDGVEFEDLAPAYSLGHEYETGGRVGPVPIGSLPGNVQMLLQRTQTGLVQPPLPVGDRYWVIRLDQYNRARLTESTRTDLVNRLFNQWLQTKVNALKAMPNAIAIQSASHELETQRL